MTTVVLGTKKGLVFVDKLARSWRARRIQLGGIPVSYAFHDDRTQTLWAALDHGHWGVKIQKSTDAGENWSEVAAPKYPEGAIAPCTRKPASLRYIYVLAPGPRDKPGRIYAGTVPGGLFVSEDGGVSFTLVDALWNHATRDKWGQGGKDFDDPGLHSVVIDPRDSRHILIGSSSAGCLATRDDGRTWEVRNRGLKSPFSPEPNPEVGFDPHFIQACASAPDVLWQQNHVGIFRSTDTGHTWTEASQESGPARFGFAIAADARDADRAWVVPATSDEKRYAVDEALCVGRTEDGGKTWTVFREGLPQESCFDVTYRHALDARGDTLVFGTTTGNLFASEDRGESWQCIGSSFPPILSVRFV
jgi:photosystem II stability/assembly factor-like uncharacterized protein